MKYKVIPIIKLVCIVYLAIFVPRFVWFKSTNKPIPKKEPPVTMIGIQNLTSNKTDNFNWIKKLRLALVSDKISNKNNLIKNGFKVQKLFLVNKKNKTLQDLTPESLANTDAIAFDMTSYGLRIDPCFESLNKTIKLAANNNKKLIILDRPNPLGRCIEGPGDIPLKPGLTTAELALYLNKYILHKPANLTIVPMTNWQANKPLANIKSDFLPKKFKNLNALYGYSFLKFLKQIRPIKVEQDGENKYQVLILPKAQQLSEWETDYLKKLCFKLGMFCSSSIEGGIKIRVKKDINNFSSFNSIINLARFLQNRKRLKLCYSPKFDKLLGSNILTSFLQNKISFENLKHKIETDDTEFEKRVQSCILYRPLPYVKIIERV